MKSARCSENLTRLMNAEKWARVRSGSGAARSFALKSAILAARAKRCLSPCERETSTFNRITRTNGEGGCCVQVQRRTCPKW